MKKINNEQILDMIYDLADAAGMRIGEFMEKLGEEYGVKALPDDLPEEIAAELAEARELKKRERDSARKAESDAAAAEEIKRFRELFPNVGADSIPEEVWEDVAAGADLPHAYAFYIIKGEGEKTYADAVNRRNSEKGAAARGDGTAEPVYTKDEVEKMSGGEVRKNYKNIVRAMKNWRFN
ncbi:MAG: hypothetical protein J6252_06125 [Clostridia bacterium]|nr:hypothetical protein [Clostridia bacterium]